MSSKKIIYTDALIFRPGYEFHVGDIAIQNGFFTDNFSNPDEIIDSKNLYLIPGLCDIHLHGCNNYDFSDGTEKALNEILNYEKNIGVTSICPTTVATPKENLFEIMRVSKKIYEKNNNFLGINIEGTFISKNKLGAHNPEFIYSPDFEFLKNLQDISGNLIKLVSIAPELNGAFDFIKSALKITNISLAHTEADYEISKKAFDVLGVNHVTHLYNAMNPINHREPGLIIAAAENKNVFVELICDGIHVHPAVIRNTLKMFGDDRIIFISDSISATGMKNGNYKLGSLDVIKNSNKATLNDKKTIAGSVTNLTDCMRIAVQKMGIKLESAIKCSTINPVKSIGLEKFYGTIESGKFANFIMLDKNLNLKFVNTK